jgi:hypothetical protein
MHEENGSNILITKHEFIMLNNGISFTIVSPKNDDLTKLYVICLVIFSSMTRSNEDYFKSMKVGYWNHYFTANQNHATTHDRGITSNHYEKVAWYMFNVTMQVK